MIERFKYIQNVGRFEQVECKDDPSLGKLTLVYSENGRGKTTTCAILRSLTTGDSTPILERRRLSATTDSKAVLKVDGADIVFDGKSWSAVGPKVLVFDEHFVDANVYSGLSIEAAHRQNLHVLVIGEEGVKYQREVERLSEEIAKLQVNVKQTRDAIAAVIPKGMSVDDFCGLPAIDDLDARIAEADKAVSVLRDAERVRNTHEFTAFALPPLRANDLEAVFEASLPDVDSAALSAVTEHFERLGPRSESWVSDGMVFKGEESTCPFCQQDTAHVDLVGHYRAYFSEEYRKHKTRIANARKWLDANLGGDALARIQKMLQGARERHAFWAKYVALPALTLAIDDAVGAFARARDALLKAIEDKASAPLDTVVLDAEAKGAIAAYESIAGEVLKQSEGLLSLNDAIATAKEKAQHGSLPTAESQFTRLLATEQRHTENVARLGAAYAKAKEEKAARDKDKEIGRAALKEHRDKVFGTHQAAINGYLVKFNADFQIESLAPSDARGVPSSTFEFIVNKTAVSTGRADGPVPSFATVLSSGDRNTLALAFFFASLQTRGTLDDVIIAIDDPASSLDDGRVFATVQEIRRLVERAEQVVVLSHSRPVLCQIWDRADKNTTASLEIRNVSGTPDASTFDSWDVEAAAITEYDQLHTLVREFADSAKGESQDVAVALRPVLEGYLRVAFVECVPPGKQLGDFLTTAKQAAQGGTPILDNDAITELDNLREYANQFHHNTSKNWQENRSNVNEQQLRGYARRVVSFTRLGRPNR